MYNSYSHSFWVYSIGHYRHEHSVLYSRFLFNVFYIHVVCIYQSGVPAQTKNLPIQEPEETGFDPWIERPLERNGNPLYSSRLEKEFRTEKA